MLAYYSRALCIQHQYREQARSWWWSAAERVGIQVLHEDTGDIS
jgi:hypothetical protein